ncbi:hypothetical protein HAX54_006415 [Datura stramonium]|uniref:Uncharacterized protein n=1 Tax=Datura stramonium TaxID=4076 RepID=A0ABS8TB28_DATST|nr:hypothetical protein [Datura stramonium]
MGWPETELEMMLINLRSTAKLPKGKRYSVVTRAYGLQELGMILIYVFQTVTMEAEYSDYLEPWMWLNMLAQCSSMSRGRISIRNEEEYTDAVNTKAILLSLFGTFEMGAMPERPSSLKSH